MAPRSAVRLMDQRHAWFAKQKVRRNSQGKLIVGPDDRLEGFQNRRYQWLVAGHNTNGTLQAILVLLSFIAFRH